ncbi:MAG: cytochrome C oxidase subunit IV family protein [Calditrichia bacterium]
MEQKHQIPISLYIMVWFTLLVFTVITVTIAGLHMGAFTIGAALLIAGIKSTLVLLYFMHLKYESSFFRLVLLMVIFVITVTLILTFFDVLFR